jgi:Phage tail tube protein
MTVSGSNGEFGIAPLPAKLGDSAFVVGDYTWRQFPALNINLAPVNLQEQLPLEISGVMTPTGAFKRGAAIVGSVDMLPRTYDVLGFLLYGLMGNVSTLSDVNIAGDSVPGSYVHVFNYNAQNTIPWMAIRRLIPGQLAADNLGEYGVDCQVTSMRIVVPNSGNIQCSVSLVGRIPSWEKDPTWVWDNTLEDGESIPKSSTGSLTFGDKSPKMLGMELMVNNMLSMANIENELIIGSPYPDDSIPLSRSATIRGTVKYADPDLYLDTFTGADDGTAWSSTPTLFATAGEVYAFDSLFLSPSEIGSTGEYNALAIRANYMTLLQDGPVQLRAANMVTQNVAGIIQTPASGDYLQVILQNGVSGYLWA